MRESKFVEAKLKGLSNTKAAKIATGTKSDKYASVAGTRMIAKDSVQAALNKALEKRNIVIDRILAPIDKGLDAKTKREVGKVVTETDEKGNPTQYEYIFEEEDNLPLQLQASDRAIKLMGLDKVHKDEPPDASKQPIVDNEALLKAIESGDMVTVQQIIFNKGS